MKKIVLFLSLAAAVSASVLLPKTKPIKPEPPVIILPTESESPLILKPIIYNYDDTTKFCPREDPNYKQTKERYDYQIGNAEDSVVFVRHCQRCNIGVYAEHDGEDVKRCTYCSDKESNSN